MTPIEHAQVRAKTAVAPRSPYARGGAYYSRNHFEPRYGHSVTPYHSHTSEPKAMIFGGYGVTHKGRDVSYFLSDMWTVDIMGRSVYRVFPGVWDYVGTSYAPPEVRLTSSRCDVGERAPVITLIIST